MEKKDTEEESSWSGLENYSVIDDTDNQYVKVGKRLVLNSIQISFEFLFSVMIRGHQCHNLKNSKFNWAKFMNYTIKTTEWSKIANKRKMASLRKPLSKSYYYFVEFISSHKILGFEGNSRSIKKSKTKSDVVLSTIRLPSIMRMTKI